MTIWHVLYSVAAWLSAALCLYTAIRHGWPDALVEIVVFVLLVVGYWLLESWATHAGSFYLYPPGFWDMVPYFPFGSLSWVSTDGVLCPYFCPAPTHCPDLDTSGGISASVVLMEASLTYAAMWTARLLAPKLMLLWPFLTGLALLSFDVFLDPVAARSRHCQTLELLHPGLGFWEWHVHAGLGTQWFWIPLFNYAAWYFAPIAAVAGALLLRWARDFFRWLFGLGPGDPPDPIDLLLLGTIFTAFTLLFALAPYGSLPISFKILVMLGVIVLSVWRVIQLRSQYAHTNAPRWAVIAPQVAFHLFSLVALVLSGSQPLLPLLLYGLVCVVLGMWYCLAPYLGARDARGAAPRSNWRDVRVPAAGP